MGKKRKAGGRPSGQHPASKKGDLDGSKFDVEETFDDSEDEFQAGRDHVLLEEAPEAKRRRKVAEEGLCCPILRRIERISNHPICRRNLPAFR